MKKIVKSIFYGMIFILSLLINVSFSNAASANNPVIVPGLTPVKYTGSAYSDTTETDSSWYNYEHGIWANAKTSNGDLYVWIPRFTYKVSADRKSVSIKWSNGKIDDISDGYIVHPAFYFDEYFGGDNYNQGNGTSSDLTGFWMKKELSSDSVSNISTAFDDSLKLTTSYGLPQSGTYTHIAKASEWGAMAYLTLAKGNYNSTTRFTTANNTGIKLDSKQEYVMGIKGNPSGSSTILKSVNRKYGDKMNSALDNYHGFALTEINNNGSIQKDNYLVRGGSLGLFDYSSTSSSSDNSKGYRTTISILTSELTDTVSFFDTEATVMEGDYLLIGVDFNVEENNWKFPEDASDLFNNSDRVEGKKPVDIKCVYEGDISCRTSDLNATVIKLIDKDLREVEVNKDNIYSAGKYTLVVRVGGKIEKNDKDVNVFFATADMQAKIIVNELNLLTSAGAAFKVGNIVTNKVTLNIISESGTTSISKAVMTRAPDKSEYALNEELDLSGGELIVYLGNFESDPISTALLTVQEEGITSSAKENYWVQELYYNDIKVEQQDRFIINVSNVPQLNVTGRVSGTSDLTHQLLSGPGKYTRGNSDEPKALITSEILDGYIFSSWQSDSSKVKASDIHDCNTTFTVPSKSGSLDKNDVILTAVYIAPESLTIQNPKKEFIAGEDFELGSGAILSATYRNSKGNTVTRQLNMGTSGVEISIANKDTGLNCSFDDLQLGEYTVTIQYASKIERYDIEVTNAKYKLTLNTNHAEYGEVSGTVKNTKNITLNTINLSNENGYISENISFGNTVNLVATPKQGYIFSKWTVEGEENLIPGSNISNQQISFVMPQKDIVVTAEFEKVYTVTFKIKQGQETYGSLTGTLSQTVIAGQATTPVTANVNDGYMFFNWLNKKGEVVSSSREFINQYVLDDEEYTAVFGKGWTVTFYSDDVLFKTIEVENGASAYIEEVPTKDEYIFAGWDKDLSSIKEDTETHAIFLKRIDIKESDAPAYNTVEAGITGNMVMEGTLQYIISSSEINPDESYTLDRISEISSGDWVTDTNNEFFRSKSVDEGQDSNALITVLSKNEKELVKFNYFISNGNNSQFGVTINGRKVISPSQDISFGEWHEFEEEVDVENGKIEIGLSYSHGENNSADDYAAIKDLVVSPKWTIIPNSYNLVVEAKEAINYVHVKGIGSDDNVVYRAVSNPFAADIRYTISYDANGGSNAPASQTKSHGGDLILSNQKPIKDKYIFAGWNTDLDGSEMNYTPGGTYSQESDTTLYAQWWTSAINFTWDTTDDLEKELELNITEQTVIDWGDGNTQTIEYISEDDFSVSHVYESEGIYTVKIMDNVVKYLNCGSQKVISLDVTHAASLEWLECQGNMINSLIVSRNPELECLICYNNPLTNLDVSNNKELSVLDCSNIGISLLDVSNNKELTYLACFNNWIEQINLENNTKLETLDCGSNFLSNLDLSKNTELQKIWCDFNFLSSLDVSNSLELEQLECEQEKLNVLVMDSRQNITTLSKGENTKIVTLTQTPHGKITYDSGYKFNITPDANYEVSALRADGVSKEPATTYDFGTLTKENTPLTAEFVGTSINFTWNTTGQLTKKVIVRTTKKTSIDWGDGSVSNVTASPSSDKTVTHTYSSSGNYTVRIADDVLTKLDIREMKVSSVDVRGATALKILYVRTNNLTNLDVSKNIALTDLSCGENNLSSLNVSQNTALKQLWCYNANLIDLDVSKNTALTCLYCSGNRLTSLDVSNNTALTELRCHKNQLTSLNANNNALLEILNCNTNQLTSLNVSHNTALTELYCYENQLTSLDVSNNTALTYLSCYSNQLTSLDVSNNTALKNLQCNNNNISNLNVNNNALLEILSCQYNNLNSLYVTNDIGLLRLNCFGNNISSLNVDNNTALVHLNCNTNQLTSLDVSHNTALTSLYCYNNQLASLNVSHNTALTELKCYSNQLTSLDVSNNTALTTLLCNANQLTSLDVTNNTALTTLTCRVNRLIELDLTHNTALTLLYCNDNQLTSLDVSHNTALTELYCYNNQLTSLDVSHNTALTRLDCYTNQLTSLDVSHNTALTTLYCHENQLTSLDVSHNTALKTLTCRTNQITELDISHNTALTHLNFGSNKITSIDVSSHTELTSLYCFSNKITSLDISNNTKLTTLNCWGNKLTSIDVSHHTALTYLHCSNNQLTSLDVSNNLLLTFLNCSQSTMTTLIMKTGQNIPDFTKHANTTIVRN